MARYWRAPFTFACIFATALAGGWLLHAQTRRARVQEFQERQLETVSTLAAVVQTGLTGTAHAVRLLAATGDAGDRAALASVLDRAMECGAPPCAAAVAVYGRDGSPLASKPRLIALDAEELARSVAWATNPGNGALVRSAIARSSAPALVIMAPTRSGGFAAEEIPFDSLFSATHEPGDATSASALLVVNHAGDVMFRTGHPEMRLNNLLTRGARCAACHQSLAHVDRMMALQRGVLQYTVRNAAQLAAVAPVRFEGDTWTAAVISPASVAVALLTSELRQFGLLAFATLIGCSVAVHMTWRERQRRQRAAAEASRRAHLERSHSALGLLNVKLETAAEEWRMTVDTIDAAVIVLDPSGPIERMNRVASGLLPGATFSWLGQPSARLADLQPWDTALALAGDALDRGGVSTARVRVPATAKTWDLWCRAPKRHDDRRSVVVVARDVSALVELQASLRRSETMAALGLVVAGVAHEVRNPLFAISSLVDAWALQPQTAPARLIGALRGEVVRLKTLMTELLEYGSPSAPELAPARLLLVVQEALSACRDDIAQRGVRVEVSVPADLDVWMDPRRLMRVFLNLLQNAAQHAPAGSLVTLEARTSLVETPCVSIEVCDEGPGFAPDDLPRLFTPFFSRRVGGFGLGLAISERIVGEHGGNLTAANRACGGACLTVTLPLRPGNAAQCCSEGVPSC